jgi:hypothetical protein
VGAVGEGFYSNGGKFISGRESLSVTAKFISEFLKGSNKRKPDKVLISKYTPIEGTILKELQDAGKVVIPYSSHDGAEEDIRYLTNLVKHSGIDTENCLEFDYESALEGRKRMFA